MKKAIALSCIAALLLAGCQKNEPAESAAEPSEVATTETAVTAEVTTAVTTLTTTTTTAAATKTTTTTTTPAPLVPMLDIVAEGAGDYSSNFLPVIAGDISSPYFTTGFYIEVDKPEGIRHEWGDMIKSGSGSSVRVVEGSKDLFVLGEHNGTLFCWESYHYSGFLRDGIYQRIDINGSGILGTPRCIGDKAYVIHDGTKGTDVYCIDFDGSYEKLCVIPDAHSIQDYRIHDGRIYYESFDYELAKKFRYKYGWYDLNTGESQFFLDGGVGQICGDYMYYTEDYVRLREKEIGIYRVPLNSGEPEYICDGGYFCGIYGGDVLYKSYVTSIELPSNSEYESARAERGRLYRIGHGKNELFFDANAYYGTDSSIISSVQIKDGRLFLKISDFRVRESIIELDGDGNVINTIYEYIKPIGEIIGFNAPKA